MINFDLRGCLGCKKPKTYLGAHFGTLSQGLVHPTAPVLLTKDSPRNKSYSFTNYFYKRRVVCGRTNGLFVNFYTIENGNGGGNWSKKKSCKRSL